MDLPPYSALADSVAPCPIPLCDLQLTHYHDMNNCVIGHSSFDPLDVLEVFQSSLTYPEWQILRSAMIRDSALIVGSSAMSAVGVELAAVPNGLDILVAAGGGRSLHTALRNFGCVL